jgi:hypothetical protein
MSTARSPRVRVDKQTIYDILDELRATIPEDIKQARWIVKKRREMLAEAEREAERIVEETRKRHTSWSPSTSSLARPSSQRTTSSKTPGPASARSASAPRTTPTRSSAPSSSTLSKFIAAIQRGRERLQGPDQPAEGG